MGLAFYYPVANHETATWQWILTLVLLLSCSVLAQQSQSQPLVDFSYLKEGKSWKQSWLQNSPKDLKKGSHFLVFLGPECPYCKQWVPLLNIMNANPRLPNVLGMMTLTESEIKEFKTKHLVHFPIVSMNTILFNYMVDVLPTALLLQDGKIKNISVADMPQEYFEEIQLFYRATVKRDESKTVVRFAG